MEVLLSIRQLEMNNLKPSAEFNPISIENRTDLQKAKCIEPIIWLWKDGEIKRVKYSIFLKVA